MPIVYVPQEKLNYNLSAALKYGSAITSCLPPDYQVYGDPRDAIERIHDALTNIALGDYLLLIGDPILIGITTAIAADLLDGAVDVLKWDAQSRTYVPVHLSL